MYINKFVCPYGIKKDENKCGRIFRPWDSESAAKIIKDNSQDCTVSTTTQEDEEIICTTEKQIVKTEVSFEPNQKEHINEKESLQQFPNVMGTSLHEDKKQKINKYYYRAANYSILPANVPQEPNICKLQSSDLSLQPSRHFQDATLYQKQDDEHLTTPDTLLQAQTSPLPLDFIQDPYNPLYSDLMQANLAQHLGLPQNDPLILESIAQGYALEEYARVLNQEQQAKLLAAKKQRPKKYKCPHCDVGFSNNGQLKGHIRIHTGERPFKCDDKDCGKTFTRNEELTRHKRIHSGLRPFPCTHCGKRFGRKDHLKKHSRTHFQPKGLYAVPVVLPFEAWASGQANGYPFFPMIY